MCALGHEHARGPAYAAAHVCVCVFWRGSQARPDAAEIEDVAVEAEITECSPQPDGWGHA